VAAAGAPRLELEGARRALLEAERREAEVGRAVECREADWQQAVPASVEEARLEATVVAVEARAGAAAAARSDAATEWERARGRRRRWTRRQGTHQRKRTPLTREGVAAPSCDPDGLLYLVELNGTGAQHAHSNLCPPPDPCARLACRDCC